MSEITQKTETGLPPDWFKINSKTGETLLDKSSNKSDFSYDAIRIFLRFYIDYEITHNTEAKNFLSKVTFFTDKWRKNGQFYTHFKQNGEVSSDYEDVGNIALLLPAIKLQDERTAYKIYNTKVKRYFNPEGYWKDSKNYYSQNLSWLGIWMLLNHEKAETIIKEKKNT